MSGAVPPEVIRHARRALPREAPPPLAGALQVLAQCGLPAEQTDELTAAAGLAHAIAGLFAEARGAGGRRLIETIFALHARLGHATAQSGNPRLELLKPLRPYQGWLTALAAPGAPLRSAVMQWIEIFDERTIMHRYSDRWHRRRHAAGLLAGPLRTLLRLPAADSTGGAGATVAEQPSERRMTGDPLILFAERMLGFWDLYHAAAQAAGGWNRIELPNAATLGGFYGLADEARPPDETAIRAGAQALLDELRDHPAPPVSPACDVLIQALEPTMRRVLETFVSTGVWQLPQDSSASPPAAGSWLKKILNRFQTPL